MRESCPRNWKIIKQWNGLKYRVNPRTQSIQTWISQTVTKYKGLSRRGSETKDFVSLTSAHDNRLVFEPIQWLSFIGVLTSERRRVLAVVRRNISTYLEAQ